MSFLSKRRGVARKFLEGGSKSSKKFKNLGLFTMTFTYSNLSFLAGELFLFEIQAGRHNTLHRVIKTGLALLVSQNQLFNYKINLQGIT